MASEADLRQLDVQPGCAPHDYFEVVVVHVYRLDEFIDEHSALALGCGFPKGIYVDFSEVRSATYRLQVRGARRVEEDWKR